MCTSCCTAIPHESMVKAMGKTPENRVFGISAICAPVAYNANTTGKTASIMAGKYFVILGFCFWICVLLMFLRSQGHDTSISVGPNFWSSSSSKAKLFYKNCSTFEHLDILLYIGIIK